jgi:hypothetical protein
MEAIVQPLMGVDNHGDALSASLMPPASPGCLQPGLPGSTESAMNVVLTLGEVLRIGEDLPFRHSLFLPLENSWNATTPCAILDADDLDEPDQHPMAVEHGVRSVIGTNEVQDIVTNAREQLPAITSEQLLEAFLFYIDNDAFIVFQATP